MGAVKTPPVSTGLELTVMGHLSRKGVLSLSAEPAGRALLHKPSRWRVQLVEWDGKSVDRHRAEIRANVQVNSDLRVPQRWPTDRLIVNTGKQLHTRFAHCDHMRAPLDKSPVVRAAVHPSGTRGIEPAEEILGLRCITCQRMVNRFDASSHVKVNGDSSIQIRFALPASGGGRLYDATSPIRQQLSSESVEWLKQAGHHSITLDPFRFNGPCTVRLVERFPTQQELNEIPEPAGSTSLHPVQRNIRNGWVCTRSFCDPAVVNATDHCGSCGTHRSWIERAPRS